YDTRWFSEKYEKNGKEITIWHYHPIQSWRKKYKVLDEEITKISEEIKGMPAGNARDIKMQKKHLLTFERNYYKGKYKRFLAQNISNELNEDEEFLKSLITDTSYISKLAALY